MAEKKTSDAQLRANKKWKNKNKAHMDYIRKRSAARSFIKVASREDLQEMKAAIVERQSELNNENKDLSAD